MSEWLVNGIRYRVGSPPRTWTDGRDVSFKAVVWRERDHPRDRRGRFGSKPGGAFSGPQAAAPAKPAGPTDKLGRSVQPGDTVLRYSDLFTVVKIMQNGRVQLLSARGKKSTWDASAVSVWKRADGSSVAGDGKPHYIRADELKTGDRIFYSPRVAYTVTGSPGDSNVPGVTLIPVRDQHGATAELYYHPEDPYLVYPPGLEMPQEAAIREANASKPSTLKAGQKFSFGIPGMDQPVYTVVTAKPPRVETSMWRDKKGEIRERKFEVIDLELRTADGDIVTGSFEDSSQARINHEPKKVTGSPFVPAKAVKVGDILEDPEGKGNGKLTVTAITLEPAMSTDKYGDSDVTHDTLFTLRDEKGSIRKIYNRSNWAGVQRAVQIDPPKPPKPEPKKQQPARAGKGDILGVPTVRPVLYTEDREEIFKMGFEDDPKQPEDVRQAVVRLRARQTISGPQASALADAVRVYNQRADVPDKKRRTNARAANWLDAAAAEIAGREQPDMAVQRTVEKVTAADLAVGDNVALVDRDKNVSVVTVRGAKSNTWGVTTLDVEHNDGRQETREVLSKAAAYLLPDTPPSTPETPAGDNRREHLHPSELRPGDITERDGELFEVLGVTQLTPWEWQVTYHPAGNEDWGKESKVEYRAGFGYPSVIRTQRGPGSKNQPWTSLMPPENPTPVSPGQVKIGDRIEVDLRSGPRRGTVIKLEDSTDGETRIAMIVTDEGDRRSTVITGDRPITRLIDSDGNGAARVEQVEAQAKANNRVQELAQLFDKHRLAAQRYAAGVAERIPSASRAPDVLREMADKGEGLKFINSQAVDEIARVLTYGSNIEVQKRVADRLRPTLNEMALREYRSLADSIEANRPLPGEDKDEAARRVVSVAKDGLNRTDNQQAARVLSDLAPELRAEGQPVPGDVSLPEIPKGSDLVQRIAAYREFIGGSGSTFGKHRVTRTVIRTPSLADLEAGIAPHTEKVTDWVNEPRAADGGPGPVTMKQLAAVQLAGRELSNILEERVHEPLFQREREIRDEMDDLNSRVSSLMDEEWRKTDSLQEEYAHQHGYANWFSMMAAASKARRQGNDDEAFRLEELMDQLGEQARQNASTREAQNAARAKHKQLADELAASGKNRKAQQRKEILRLIGEARGEPMGRDDIEFDFVGREPGDTPGRIVDITDEDKEKLAQAMGFATDSYPASWLDRITNTYKIKKSTRGFHSWDGTVIALSLDTSSASPGGMYGPVAVHELGHGMEARVPGLNAAENAFLWHRTATGEVGSRTRPDPTTIYAGTTEVGWEDDFKSHYTGRWYGNEKAGFEVFTTGYEDLAGAGDDYVDDEFRDWTLGVLALL